MGNEPTKEGQAEKPVSDYAPKPKDGGQKPAEPSQQPSNGQATAQADNGANGAKITPNMIAPGGEVGDAMRLTRIVGPALDQIGHSTAEQAELVAVSMVENAKRGADTILVQAKAQAANMVERAEAQAAELRLYAASIRKYTDWQAHQVNYFCGVAESTLGTIHALKSQFEPLTIEEARAEAEGGHEIVDLPKFLNRNLRNTSTAT